MLPPVDGLSDDADLAIVIDVLRATSVMATALSAGAARVMTQRKVDAARSLADTIRPRPLLCGERGCKPILGFDRGNSPSEYQPETVSGKTLVMSTTNGTAAIEAAANAKRVVAASFLNFSAVVEAAKTASRVDLVCAGTNGEVTGEDVLLAGALAHSLHRKFAASPLCDTCVLARQFWVSWFGTAGMPAPTALANRLRETQGGRNLIRVGYSDDILRCSQIDLLDVVPERVAARPATFELTCAGSGPTSGVDPSV